jgi:hypothetical protein
MDSDLREHLRRIVIQWYVIREAKTEALSKAERRLERLMVELANRITRK